MSIILDCSGGLMQMGLMCDCDEEFFQARMEGREPVETAFKPRLANIAPRTKDSWAPTRSNTQQPPLTGPNKNEKPQVVQPRSAMFPQHPHKIMP